MKQLTFGTLVVLSIFLTGPGISACKNKAKDTNTTTSVDSNTAKPTPVEIAPDDALRKGAEDATKDYPGVTATVNNGEVTLTGTIDRDRLPKLLQAIHELN